MSLEFQIIEQYFKQNLSDETVGIGDDSAVIDVALGSKLLVTVDAMVEGVHFLKQDDPFSLGYKLAAVNISDIAAMAGKPKWATLSLTLSKAYATDEWLSAFSQGLFSMLNKHAIALVGGDTTQGAQIVLSLQLMGESSQPVLRSSAKEGNLVFVTGFLGAAAFALNKKLKGKATVSTEDLKALHFPEPPLAFGQSLSGLATAMIDVSDGLIQDLSHILKASGVGACLEVLDIPVAKECFSVNDQERYNFALSGGEDYQLCFTVKECDYREIMALADKYAVSVTMIGKITAGEDLLLLGLPDSVEIEPIGFSHF